MSQAGFHYQAAYASARLAAMHVETGIFGATDHPIHLRYEWAEDVDEVLADGTVCFTQCKHVARILEPASLADVFLGFAPKWLGVAESDRPRVRFRLVCTDDRAKRGLEVANAAQTRKHFLHDLELATARGGRGDLATWLELARAFGGELLFEALWSRTDILHVPATVHRDRHPAAPLFEAEREGLRVLLEHEKLEPSGQASALRRLRGLLHDNLIEFDPSAREDLPERAAAPRELSASDVRTSLFELAPRGGRRLPFEVIDPASLRRLRLATPVEPFLARLPRWADVARGEDRTTRFVERDQTKTLVDLVLRTLVDPIDRALDHRLQALFVVGGPGSGKTTLVRRVAAILVESGRVVVADPGVDPGEPADDPQTFASHVLELSDRNLPVLLVLDDPLYEDSQWPQVVRKLARPGVRVAVLAASPRFVFDRFAEETLRGIDVSVFDMIAPTAEEHRRLAEHHERPVASHTPDDFLALALETAMGESFPAVIKRLWSTLNEGTPAREARFETLAWPVRALFFVAFLQRTGIRCPEPLLASALAISGGPEHGFAIDDALAMLNESHGWKIFRRHDRERGSGFHGAQLATAHVRIAEEAWALRPPPRTQVGPLLVRAAVLAPETGRSLALALVRLEKMAALRGPDSKERALIELLATTWNEAAIDGAIATRHSSDVATVLRANGFEADAKRLAPAFERAASSERADGWIAAFELRALDTDFADVSRTIGHADFSVAPIRARRFARLIENDELASAALQDRLLAALEGKTTWRLPSSLLVWLIAHAKDPATIASRLGAVETWLREHPHDVPARIHHLSFLARLAGPSYDRNREAAVTTIHDWLLSHREDVAVRAQFLHALMKWRSPELRRVVEETLALGEEGTEEHLALNVLKAAHRLDVPAITLRAVRWAANILERVDYARAAEMVVSAMIRPYKQLERRREEADPATLAAMDSIERQVETWHARNPDVPRSSR